MSNKLPGNPPEGFYFSHESPGVNVLRPIPVDGEPFAAQAVPVVYPEPVRARDHANSKSAPAFSYTREQKGHSLILHLLLGGIVLWIPAIYYTVSPRHFWHA